MVDAHSFPFCGSFSGSGSISAAKWIKKLEYELKSYQHTYGDYGNIQPKKLLESVDLLLIGNAAEWAITNFDASRLLNEENPTSESVTTFKRLFQEKFPAEKEDLSTINFDFELNKLQQQPAESISSYYNRTISLMSTVGARDRLADNSTLSPLESAILDIIMKAFIKGLANDEIKRDVIKGISIDHRSLRELYTLAENANRAKTVYKELLDEIETKRDLIFYRTIARRHLSQEKIDSLMASYLAHPDPDTWSYVPAQPWEKDYKWPPDQLA